MGTLAWCFVSKAGRGGDGGPCAACHRPAVGRGAPRASAPAPAPAPGPSGGPGGCISYGIAGPFAQAVGTPLCPLPGRPVSLKIGLPTQIQILYPIPLRPGTSRCAPTLDAPVRYVTVRPCPLPHGPWYALLPHTRAHTLVGAPKHARVCLHAPRYTGLLLHVPPVNRVFGCRPLVGQWAVHQWPPGSIFGWLLPGGGGIIDLLTPHPPSPTTSQGFFRIIKNQRGGGDPSPKPPPPLPRPK